MEVKKPPKEKQGRGSGPTPQKPKSEGPRKPVVIRMPEEQADRLKAVAALEGVTTQDFCLEVIIPHLNEALKKHGLAN